MKPAFTSPSTSKRANESVLARATPPRLPRSGVVNQAMPSPKPPSAEIKLMRKDLLAGSRAALARAITLIESRRADHQSAARDLVQALLPDTGKAIRVGITGSPGVGKSTTIDALGMFLIEQGHKVAVLAVDPSSARTGGSILGDKTRMARLAASENAYIRPSPASGTLGGVAAKTREAMLLCEAAGFGVVLVETVGIGQSETAVCDMTDFFLALMLPGAGDELQGIKKGLVELADMIAINKADGDNIKRADLAAAEYRGALHILTPRSEHWHPPVITYSALTKTGIDVLWQKILDHRTAMNASGEFAGRRRQQQIKWMWTMLEQRMMARLRADPGIRAAVKKIEAEVGNGRIAPALAAEQIAEMLR
jgi:LAO/AO transport system kinase